MFSYATVKEYWYFLDKFKEYSEFSDVNSLTGALNEYQRLFVLDQLVQALPSGGRVLEVGGGLCTVMTALLKRHPNTYECWCVDPLDGQGSGPTFESAKQHIHKNIKVIREKIGASSSLPPQYFDFCFSISVLDYIPLPEWKVCFQDMVRVCKPGATMVHTISAPVDYRLAFDRLFKLKQAAGDCGVLPLNHITFEVPDVLNNNDTFYVSPAVYAKWIQHMPAGQNSLRTGIFQRTTAFNTMGKVPTEQSKIHA